TYTTARAGPESLDQESPGRRWYHLTRCRGPPTGGPSLLIPSRVYKNRVQALSRQFAIGRIAGDEDYVFRDSPPDVAKAPGPVNGQVMRQRITAFGRFGADCRASQSGLPAGARDQLAHFLPGAWWC